MRVLICAHHCSISSGCGHKKHVKNTVNLLYFFFFYQFKRFGTFLMGSFGIEWFR